MTASAGECYTMQIRSIMRFWSYNIYTSGKSYLAIHTGATIVLHNKLQGFVEPAVTRLLSVEDITMRAIQIRRRAVVIQAQSK